MGVRRYRELIAWQLADAFKREVLSAVQASSAACADRRYRDQIVAASTAVTADIAEGFLRRSPGDFARFLGFALGSLGEAECRLEDGITLHYFEPARCARAFNLARRASVAITRLRRTQLRPRRT